MWSWSMGDGDDDDDDMVPTQKDISLQCPVQSSPAQLSVFKVCHL